MGKMIWAPRNMAWAQDRVPWYPSWTCGPCGRRWHDVLADEQKLYILPLSTPSPALLNKETFWAAYLSASGYDYHQHSLCRFVPLTRVWLFFFSVPFML